MKALVYLGPKNASVKDAVEPTPRYGVPIRRMIPEISKGLLTEKD